jgi:hypothetical protein
VILRELGYTTEDIAALRKDAVVWFRERCYSPGESAPTPGGESIQTPIL